ncbi:MAG TPA: hypothetical protein VGN23_05200 [Verrucomicrobiae bacterium]|jgi:hypothetical protein
MSAPARGALMLVRLVAVCVIVIGLLDVGLYLTQCFEPKHRAPVKPSPIIWNLIPTVIGIVILVRARAISEWVADKLE